MTKRNPSSKTGRKPATWTKRDIETFKRLCSIQCTEQEICAVMGVSDKTLVKLINRYLYKDITGNEPSDGAEKASFSEAFKRYSAGGLSSLRRAQYEAALRGNASMLIWLGKQWLGQTDKADERLSRAAAPRFYFDPNEAKEGGVQIILGVEPKRAGDIETNERKDNGN
jgi:hypothetical protein